MMGLCALALLTGCAAMSDRSGSGQTAPAQGAAPVLTVVPTAESPENAKVAATSLWSEAMARRHQRWLETLIKDGIEVRRTADHQIHLILPEAITFDTNSAQLHPQILPLLDALSRDLLQDSAWTMSIIGHTDSTGSDELNLPLSLNRASTVRDALQSRGLPLPKITVLGRGSAQPIADNQSAAGRASNRRVELFIREPYTP